ncbi:MAG: glycosyltransferase, partial [Gemmatimonadota bacterium]|nr:glycosyltransferase [Gemmatimonadota bacterium]
VFNGVVPPERSMEPRCEFLVMSAGRAWDPAKGMDVLDRAMGRLGPEGAIAHLFGETEAPHGARFVPRHMESHGRVGRAEVDRWMGRTSVYVAASRYEPFGLAPLEAAFHGCALVLSDIGSFRELWNGCALFFPPGDVDALAAALAELRERPERCAALATAARTRAERRYTAGRMTSAYGAVYRELLAARPASALHAPSPHRV